MTMPTLTLNDWGLISFSLARRKGFHDGCGDPGSPQHLNPQRIASRLALIHAEVSEALECVARGEMTTDYGELQKPEGFPAELADIFLRLVDLAHSTGVDLDAAVLGKHEFNLTRPLMHGGKRL